MDQEIKQEFEKLASIIQQGFNRHDDEFEKVHLGLKRHDDEFENLAIMTQRGFDEAKEEINEKLTKINERIDQLSTDTDAFFNLHKKLDDELTITQHHYQDLDNRVTILETTKT